MPASGSSGRQGGVRGIARRGPNCEGVWSVRSKVLLTFGSAARRETLSHAPVAMISQSGSMAGAVARQLQDSGFGCAYIVSVGNETVLGLLDYLEYIIDQDDVRVVLLFLEGLKSGERLLRLAERAQARHRDRGAEGRSSTPGAPQWRRIRKDDHRTRDLSKRSRAGRHHPGGKPRGVHRGRRYFRASRFPLTRWRDRARDSTPGGTRADRDMRGAQPRLDGTDDNVVPAILPVSAYQQPNGHDRAERSQPLSNARASRAGDQHQRLLVQLANRGPSMRCYLPVIAEAARARSPPTRLSFLSDALPGADRLVARHGLLCARDPADAVRYLDRLYRAPACPR
jgi:hypothetical protein